MSNGHRWAAVGDEMLRFIAPTYQENGDLHWPTLAAGTACLAGEMALLGHVRELPEMGHVQDEKVSEFIYDTRPGHNSLWTYMALISERAYGVSPEVLPTFAHVMCSAGTMLLPGDFPALDVPAHVVPRETPLNAGPRTRKSVLAIAAHHGMQHADAAFCLATAAMKAVGFGRQLGLRDMTVLALESMVAGARFVPLASVSHAPAIGSVSDILPRSGGAAISPPTLDDNERDIWGVSTTSESDEHEPEERHAPVRDETQEQRVAFGRRR